MDTDDSQIAWRYTDERLAELVEAARDEGASHPLLTLWPAGDPILASNIPLFAMLHDPEVTHRDG